MTKLYDNLIFIGRFQPFHIGHQQVLNKALLLAKNVIIAFGSCYQPRTIKNPWTVKERRMMIEESLNLEDLNRVQFIALRDKMYNNQQWVAHVQQEVNKIVQYPASIGLIGHDKDQSTYYLKMFPQWTLVDHELHELLNATDLRELYFEEKSLKFLQSLVPASVFKYLESFKSTPDFKTLVTEYNFIKKYKEAWKIAPYPPTFVTVDAIVVQSGHVLLVQRKAAPGAKLWALPGGFVNQTEWLEEAVLRELREETKLKVPAPVLRGSIKNVGVYDKPERSLRGRTITHAYLIELPAGPLPPVKGGDDAARAKWIAISDIKEQEMFEDHYAIIEDMLGKL